MTKLTVILTTFNKKESLEKTLASLENQATWNFEVNIMDDSSTDETKRFCEDYVVASKIPCRYIRFEREGYNLPLMRNIGAEMARGEYLIFVDDDIIVVPSWIEEYKQHFEENPEQVYLGRLLYVRSDVLASISPGDIRNQRFDKLKLGLLSPLDPRKDVLKDVDLYLKVWGGNLGIKRRLFNSLNGVDEDFDSWGGVDSDLGFRLMRKGCNIVLLDDCTGYHLGTDFKPLEKIRQQPGVRLFNEVKRFDPTNRRNTRVKSRASFPISMIYDGSKFATELYKDE